MPTTGPANQAAETIPQTQANLVAYFLTGDTPNQYAYEEMIATFFYLFQEAIDAANTASTNATAAKNSVAATQVSAGGAIVYSAVNVGKLYSGSVGTVTGQYLCTVTLVNYTGFTVAFTTPASDTNYQVLVRNLAYSVSGKTVNGFTVTYSGTLYCPASAVDFLVFGL